MRLVGTPEERFWPRVARGGPDECWLWLGATDEGYGRFSISPSVRVRSHRFAYERLVGPIPDGLVLDHLCRRRVCANPAHLEPVTHRENILRGTGMAARHVVKTHCANGHAFTPENTIRYGPEQRWRDCRICRAARDERRRAA